MFFFILGYLAMYILDYIFATDSNIRLVKIFWTNPYPNTPLWFLRCLFIDNMIFLGICMLASKIWHRFIGCLFFGFWGYLLWLFDIFPPLNLTASLLSMPFFGLGYLTYKFNIFSSENVHNRKCEWCIILMAVVSMFLSFYFEIPHILFLENSIIGPVILAYVISIIMVMGAMFIFKRIGRLPLVSYIGRYSLIVLGLHMPVQAYVRPIVYILLNKINLTDFVVTNVCVYIGVVMVSVGLIKIMLRVFPYFVAQKDLVHYNHSSMFKISLVGGRS